MTAEAERIARVAHLTLKSIFIGWSHMMLVDVQEIDGSHAIIIPKEILSRMGLKVGDQLELMEQAGIWMLRPIKQDATSDDDMDRQLRAAALCMEKYKVALKRLAD
jgi:bifunctional DNA-binding transcriptional regulator/antitoxin component of YhaV-PrlF toxin-antitoxin module